MIKNDSNASIPERPEVLVNSSNIQGYSYNAGSYILTLWYKGKHPSIYRFYNVFPPMLSDIFVSGASAGKRARNVLKGLQYQKLQ